MIEGDWSRARHWTAQPARRDRHDAYAGRPRPDRTLAISRAACGRRSPERPGERSGVTYVSCSPWPTSTIRSPAPQTRRAARRRGGPVRRRVSALRPGRAFSSGWPSKSADDGTRARASFPNTGAARRRLVLRVDWYCHVELVRRLGGPIRRSSNGDSDVRFYVGLAPWADGPLVESLPLVPGALRSRSLRQRAGLWSGLTL